MANMDSRFLLNTPFSAWPAEVKAQLVDAVEHTPLWPRGSTGEAVPSGSSVVYFDFPPHLLFFSGPETYFDITFTFSKPPLGNSLERRPLDESDKKVLVLVENFVAHAFTRFQFLVNNIPVRTDGFADRGLAMIEDFIGCHLREDAKVMMSTSDMEPFYNTYLHNTEWKLASTRWENYAAKLWNGESRGVTVSYRPMCFPFMTAFSPKDTYVIPSMNQQLSVACYIDPGLNNIYTLHPDTTAGYTVALSSMSLNLSYARLSPAGERAITGSPSKGLAEYPGTFIYQQPVFVTKGDRQVIVNFPNAHMPTGILVQAYSADMLATGKKVTSSPRHRPIDPNLQEYSVKFNDTDVYTNNVNPGKLTNSDMKLLARRRLYLNPFFDLPVHQDVGKNEIPATTYNMPHVYIDCTNGAGQPIQTVNPSPDPKKGKLAVTLTGKSNGGLAEFYMVNLIYKGCGVLIDRARRSFINSYFTA